MNVPERPKVSLLLWLVVTMTLPTLAAWAYFVLLDGQPAARWAYAGSKVVQFALPLAWLWLGGWHHRQELPRTTPRRGWSLAMGAAFGLLVTLAAAGLYVGLLRDAPFMVSAAEAIRRKLVDLGVDSPARFLALAVFLSVIHSWLEEYYWRWFVFGRWCELVDWRWAVALSSLAFAAHHVIVLWAYFPDNWPMLALLSAGVAAGGAAWAVLYHRTGSLAGAWFSHLLVDAGLMLIGFDMAFRATVR